MLRKLFFLGLWLQAAPCWAIPRRVQHSVCPGQGGNATTISRYNCRLPNAVLSGNAVLIAIAGSGSAAPTPSSVTDDKSNAYSAVAGATKAGLNNKIFVYQLCNITNGPQMIQVQYASAQAEPYRTVVISEYYHIATTTCVDTSIANCSGAGCSVSNPSLTLTTGSFTTTVNGDLIWSFGVLDDTSYADTFIHEVGSCTPQGSFSALHCDLIMYHMGAEFVQSSLGTNNYNIFTYSMAGCTGCSTEDWITGTVALKVDDTKGTAPTVGAIHVDTVYHLNLKTGWTNTQAKTQIPRGSGNLIIWMGAAEPCCGQLTAISDGVNSWATPITYNAGGDVWANLSYTSQPTSTDTAVLTWTYSGSVVGGEPVWILVVSNAALNAPHDKHITCTGNDTGGAFLTTITCENSITPAQTNELLVGVVATHNNAQGQTAVDAGPAPAKAIVADSCVPILGANCATSPEIATSPIDENDGAAIAYLTTTATVTPTWIFNNDTTTGTGVWTDIHALFEQAPPAVGGRLRTLLGVGR